jgi:hypothetical protein
MTGMILARDHMRLWLTKPFEQLGHRPQFNCLTSENDACIPASPDIVSQISTDDSDHKDKQPVTAHELRDPDILATRLRKGGTEDLNLERAKIKTRS